MTISDMNPEYESSMSSKTGSNQVANKSVASATCASNDTMPRAAVAEESSSRRKRSFVRRQQRRGGESHMTLFKAAALASMASPGGCDGGSDDDDGPIATQQRLSLLLPIAPPVPELGDQSDSEESCRKRMRRPCPNNYLSVIEQTSSILGDLRVATSQSFDETTKDDEDMTPSCQASNHHLKKG